MALKVMNAIGWILFWGKLAFAFIPAVWIFATDPSAARLGVAIAWVFIVLFTKPTAWYQKW